MKKQTKATPPQTGQYIMPFAKNKQFVVTMQAIRGENFKMTFSIHLEGTNKESAIATALMMTANTRKGFTEDKWEYTDTKEIK